MVRVRYKNNNGVLTSSEMLCGNDFVVATITSDATSHGYTVTTLQTQQVLVSGVANTLAAAKSTVKAALEDLGVPFEDEVRRRKEKPTATTEAA